MEYKELNFEIDNYQIKFRNIFTIPFIVIFVTLLIGGGFRVSHDLTALTWYIVFSLGLLLLFYRLLFSIFFKTKIHLSEIAYVDLESLKSSTDKTNFRGTGRISNYFPSGLNKKKADKIMFIHRKRKKIVFGFPIADYIAIIKTFQANGIAVNDRTKD